MHPLAKGAYVMLASVALLVALAAGGATLVGYLALAGVAIFGIMGVVALAKKEPPPTPPWACASCEHFEVQFERQCGACGAYRGSRLKTEHLILREWRDSDLEPFAALNADPRVMEFLPGVLNRAQSDALAARIREGVPKHGFGLWAVEVPGVAPFIGFIGLSVPDFTAPFTPCVELGFRLAFDHWELGYATEGTMAALNFGFGTAKLREIVSFTVSANMRSRRVMEKCGLTRDPTDDFDHPSLPMGHRLRPHVLYRISR